MLKSIGFFFAALVLAAGMSVAPALSDPPATDLKTLEAEGQALLRQFLDPKADRAAMTAKLKPAPADIRAVYDEPLSTQMIEGYAQLFVPGIAIGPKEGQDDLLFVLTTTGELKKGAEVAKEFPGGYAQVARYIKADVPIVRFKFVKQGETMGMAFDGLVHVNGKWVFMPKPWRYAEQN